MEDMNNNEHVQQEQPRLPRIGEPAPQFEAVTTTGTVKLEDYKGKWLVLFSHPADFTPVCTTEFLAFTDIYDQLKGLNCELLGLSVDSLFSHIAWIRNIEEKFGRIIEFPIIADFNAAVAKLYGMVMPGDSDTSTSRCVFLIDDSQIVRAMICYPLSTGRNTKEILRLVVALQVSDQHGIGTPANWSPGDNGILYPPFTQQEADERMKAQSELCRDWYFCETAL